MNFGPKKPNNRLVEVFHDDIEAYIARDVLPHVPDAWVDYGKTKVGYEIPINRHFYVYKPPRPLHQIEADINPARREDRRAAEGAGGMTEVPAKVREAYQELPPSWKLEKLKFFADVRNSNVDKTISEDEDPVQLCNYTDVYYNDRITTDLHFMEGSATERKSCVSSSNAVRSSSQRTAKGGMI